MSHFGNDQLARLRRQRRVEHLHRLGPRAIDELLIEVADRIGGGPVINRLLAEFDRRLTARQLRAAGGDRFPRRPLRSVPPDLGSEANR
jgi:hypothetical protein